MKHSDRLPEKAIRSSKPVVQTKLTNKVTKRKAQIPQNRYKQTDGKTGRRTAKAWKIQAMQSKGLKDRRQGEPTLNVINEKARRVSVLENYIKNIWFALKTHMYTSKWPLQWSGKNAQSLMHRHFVTVLAVESRGSTKMLRKDHCLPVNAKFVSVG